VVHLPGAVTQDVLHSSGDSCLLQEATREGCGHGRDGVYEGLRKLAPTVLSFTYSLDPIMCLEVLRKLQEDKLNASMKGRVVTILVATYEQTSKGA